MQKRKEINIQIGERIKKSREASGYTQEKFTEAIDVSSDYLLFGKQETNDISATFKHFKYPPPNQLEF